MNTLFWQSGWVVIFAWLTYATGQTLLMPPPPIKGRLRTVHDYIMRPFGAVLTFVLASLTLLAAWGLVQVFLRGN